MRGFRSSSRLRREGDDVYIVSAARTAVGKYQGAFKETSAGDLGVAAIKAAVYKSGLRDLSEVPEIYFGKAFQKTNEMLGKEVVLGAGFPSSTDVTTINKQSASGMKAVILAARNIQSGAANVMVAAGMESTSRSLSSLDDSSDGVWGMNFIAEETAKKHEISQSKLSSYETESYRRAKSALESGLFKFEIAPVAITTSSSEAKIMIERDELIHEQAEQAKSLNSSGDGAAAVVLVAESRLDDEADDLIRPLGRIVSYAEVATSVADALIAPSLCIPTALRKAGRSITDITKFEISGSSAVVPLVNSKLLGLDLAMVNAKGGDLAMGHTFGASGCRMLVTLLYSLKEGEYGVASVCDGSGGASAIVVQRM
ncbi:acetyl-CoA acetyltransferase [Myxozyma melibiosi]|uniref:acetyl-CoA C-acetyltransferase n=1 Tax=Myxozyma melibiosi TaxID=54550 RepID=A0ABR1EY11_9ASCO